MTRKTNSLVDANGVVRPGLRTACLSGVTAVAVLGGALWLHGPAVHADAVSASPLDDSSVSALTATDKAMESLAARVTPAVVNVAVTSRAEDPQQQAGLQGIDPSDLPPGFAQFFGQGGGRRMQGPQPPQFQHGVGSGVIISPDGYIVTNDHVVDGAMQIKITLHDRRVLTAKVVGVDKLTDLAVVKVDAHDLPAISWGDSSRLQPGQTVLAFGSPFGYFQFSVTRGIVSAVNRPNPYSDDARKPGGYIQTDAAINPGNSGGPLVNSHGELVGINTFIISNSGSFAGAGFAIPAQIAQATAQQIIKTGAAHHGYIGVSLNDVTPDNAHFFNMTQASGAIVAQVTPDSPASRAGLKNGDVITGVNGQEMLNGSALQVAVADLAPGTKVKLNLMRDGKAQTVDLTVGEFHPDEVAQNGDAGADKGQSGKLGLALADVTPEVRQQLHLPEGVNGAAVETVRPGSPAEDAGLQPGDVIVQMNRREIGTARQAVDAVHANTAGKDLLLLVWSHGGESYRVVHLDQS